MLSGNGQDKAKKLHEDHEWHQDNLQKLRPQVPFDSVPWKFSPGRCKIVNLRLAKNNSLLM